MCKEVFKIENVRKEIRGKIIIQNLNLSIKQGEVVGLIGPNGSGKSTIMKMITNLTKINQGSITVMGYDLHKNFKKAISHIGGVIETPKLYSYLSGWDNLIHYARITNHHHSVSEIYNVINIVGLKDKIYEKVKTYSMGMKQRLAIAQAIVNKPSILILDEITNGLDPEGVIEIRKHLLSLAKKSGIAILISSHILSEIELMCDRIAIIKNGQLKSIFNIQENELLKEQKIIITTDAQHSVDDIKKNLNKFTLHNNEIHITDSYKNIPNIIRNLSLNGVNIYKIDTKEESLEEKFLKLTSEDK